jgi:N-hydroxyarylamine O-acetyltransferase
MRTYILWRIGRVKGPSMFDLDAYLSRIHLCGIPSLANIHRSHVHAIPFENLDSRCGQVVSLDLEELTQKLVVRRRGGYCFEQNLLLKAACEALGAEVETYLARVRWRAPVGTMRPRAHLVLGVRTEGSTWHADVGFGAGTPLEPMPFGPGGPYEQSGWLFRIVEEDSELVLQRLDGKAWGDVYAFSKVPSPFVDIETSNWFVSTNPSSPFVSGLIVGRRPLDGSVEILSDWSGELLLTTETVSETTRTRVDVGQLPQILATRFGLPGFEIGDDEKLAQI